MRFLRKGEWSEIERYVKRLIKETLSLPQAASPGNRMIGCPGGGDEFPEH
jgi:hypothetical protein